MSMSGARPGVTGTPPFRERSRPSYGKSPGPSNSPVPQFAPAPSAHQTFTPSKQSSSKTPSNLPKAPKAPEKPLMPYMRYSRKVWDSVKAKNVELRLWQIGKIIGQMWRELSDAERKEYNDAYEADKVQYQENLKIFHNSAQYQNYLREKQRAEHQLEEEERRSKTSAANEHRVSIQPSDYEMDTENGVSVKSVASARYHRNHTLVNEIFSDSLVPDGRSVVTEQRMTVLRKQVRSLMDHQQKLENELTDITEKFSSKKRKFLDSSEEFAGKLKVECDNKPLMTSARFDALVIKHKAELRVKYDKMLEQQKQQQERKLTAQVAAQQQAQQLLDQQPVGQQQPHISPQTLGQQTNQVGQPQQPMGQQQPQPMGQQQSQPMSQQIDQVGQPPQPISQQINHVGQLQQPLGQQINQVGQPPHPMSQQLPQPMDQQMLPQQFPPQQMQSQQYQAQQRQQMQSQPIQSQGIPSQQPMSEQVQSNPTGFNVSAVQQPPAYQHNFTYSSTVQEVNANPGGPHAGMMKLPPYADDSGAGGLQTSVDSARAVSSGDAAVNASDIKKSTSTDTLHAGAPTDTLPAGAPIDTLHAGAPIGNSNSSSDQQDRVKNETFAQNTEDKEESSQDSQSFPPAAAENTEN